MKALLVNPRIGTFGSDGCFPPVGLCSLAANSGDHPIGIWDEGAEPERLVDWRSYDLIGFFTTTPGMTRVRQLVQMIRVAHRKAIVVYGGPHVTALPEDRFPEADVVLRGEGELPFRWFLEHGTVRENWPPIADLNTLRPPAYSLVPWRRYRGQPVLGNRLPIGIVNTSRGCPYHCGFCNKSVFGSQFRALSAERVLLEILSWVERGAKEWTVSDDAFATQLDRAHKICSLILEAKLNPIPWTCSNGIRADTPPDLLRHMREAGCYRIAMGLESGSQRVLEDMGKHLTLDEARQGVAHAKAAGLLVHGFFILGTPWDNPDTMRETARFAADLPLDTAQFSLCQAFPGTAVSRIVTLHGRTLPGTLNIYDHTSFEMPGQFTADQALNAQQHAYRTFYLRRALRPQTWRLFWRKTFA